MKSARQFWRNWSSMTRRWESEDVLLDMRSAKPEAKPMLEAGLTVLSRVFRKTNQIATQPAK